MPNDNMQDTLKVEKYIVLPGLDQINKMDVHELTLLKITVQHLEEMLCCKIRLIIQT